MTPTTLRASTRGPARADTLEPVQSEYERVLTDAEATLDEVDGALARLNDGTYGVCDTCGAPIDEDRLAESPLIRSCGQHD